MGFHYLSVGTDAKTVKGEQFGWLTFIMYLAPHAISKPFGGSNVCPFASPGCTESCLYTSGMGKFTNVQEARIRKTVEFFKDRKGFLERLEEDVKSAIKYADKRNMKACFRLNGTSDINWASLFIPKFPDLVFYDYTKGLDRVLHNDLPNYSLTFSRSENNHDKAMQCLENGHNVAVVFNRPEFPETWNGFEVINGDQHDLRFTDKRGVVVGLKAKGDAKKDKSGFVVQV